MSETKLYRRNSLGIGTWRIYYDPAPSPRLVYAHAITMGGSEVVHHDLVTTNQSGRNIEQQAELEMASRISRMLDKGYKHSVEEAQAGSTNQMGFINPMLALPLNRAVNVSVGFSNPAHVQPKLDGHRCLITNFDGEIVAYSRKGKPITSIPHILRDFSWLGDGRTVDGELYIHGMPLQAISSLIKRNQLDSAKLRFHWYDFVSVLPFSGRWANMLNAVSKVSMPSVDLVETTCVTSIGLVFELFAKHRSQGYEGSMLRLDGSGYEDNKRSRSLLKVKEREDCEVTVVGAVPSKDGWAILRVRMDNGIEFDTSAPGSVPEKTEVMKNIASYIGRRLTIEYAMLTNDGVPFHAVATRWHEVL